MEESREEGFLDGDGDEVRGELKTYEIASLKNHGKHRRMYCIYSISFRYNFGVTILKHT